MNRGNTLVYTLLGLTIAAIVGLCFAPLQLRPCGHRCSLADLKGFPIWQLHECHGIALRSDLRVIHESIEEYRKDHGRLEKALFEMVPPNGLSDDYTWRSHYKFTYTPAANGGWQVSVARTPSLPGWYLLTSNGQVHFSEKGPATPQDLVLEEMK